MPPSSVMNASRDSGVYTTSNGAPVTDRPYEAQRVGLNGPLLLSDFHHIDLLAHFDRERIPERVVHAKGAGAHGYFEVTEDISDICCAKLFAAVGTKAKATARFSTVGGESGSADTARDPRGFSVKIRTEEGNWDLVYNNTPVFFVRDPAKFPHFIHTQKRDPATHLKDADMFWDFLSTSPESIHQVMILFGDRGVPDGYRFMHGYSGHTHKLVNDKGEFVYAQIHLRSEQGVKFIEQGKSVELAGLNPDYSTQDLYAAIEKGESPKWSMYIQTMSAKQAEDFRYSVFDLTKIWPHSEYPLRKVGELVLDENPQNYFAEVEQVAFAPSHLVPGIEPTVDPMLQSRLFSYPDTHRHRLGVNYQQLPVNAPIVPVVNFQRDGAGAFNNQGARPNYQSSILPLQYKKKVYTTEGHEKFMSSSLADLSDITELDFEQPRDLWRRVYDDAAKERFVGNVSGHLGGVKSEEIKARQLAVFAAVDQDLSDRIAKAIGADTVKPFQPLPASKARPFREHLAPLANGA